MAMNASRAAAERPARPAWVPELLYPFESRFHVTWHVTTIAFLIVGSALVLSGSVLHGDTARGFGLLAASASTGFAALAVGLGVSYTQSPRSTFRSLFLHPGPAMLTVTAALAWWGAL
jgi:hypothetical protein